MPRAQVCHYAMPDEVVTGCFLVRSVPGLQSIVAKAVEEVLGMPSGPPLFPFRMLLKPCVVVSSMAGFAVREGID